MLKLEGRLKKLQSKAPDLADIDTVESIIKDGRYYDELTEEEKEAVARYWKTDRNTYEEVWGGFFNNLSLHFQVERLVEPKTPEESEARLKELDEVFNRITEEYNSPEAIAKRKAEDEERTRIMREYWDAIRRGENPPPTKYDIEDREQKKRWEAWKHRNDKAYKGE